MQTAQDFRRGAITLANLKGPLRTAQRHVERRATELKAIGPVARRLQNGYLDVLDRATTRSNGQLERQVIEAMRRAVQVEEAEARGEKIGWLVAEHAPRQFWIEISDSSELHEGSEFHEGSELREGAVIRAELQNPATSGAANGFAPGGCYPPRQMPVQIDPVAARRYISLARRKYEITNDILHTAVDTIAPLGLDLQPCTAIAEAMRTYEHLADYVRRVSRRVIMFDRTPQFPIPDDLPRRPPRTESPSDPARRFEPADFIRDETVLRRQGTFRLVPGVFTMPGTPQTQAGEGRFMQSNVGAPTTWTRPLRTSTAEPSSQSFASQSFVDRSVIDHTLWSSRSATPSTD